VETVIPQSSSGPHCFLRSSMTRWLWLALMILAVTLATCATSLAQEREMQDLSTKLAEKITNSGKKSVAVVDFTDLQGNVTELGRFLAEELSVSLAEDAKGFSVIDRTHLKAILQEHKLAANGLIDPETAMKLGEITGVQALVTGSIVPLGDNVWLSVKVLDPATAAMIAAASTQVPKTQAVADLLGRGIGSKSESLARLTTTPGPSSAGAGPAPVVSVRERDVLFVVRKCARNGGGELTCVGAVTDEAEQAINLYLDYDHSGYILDNLGNQYSQGGVTLGASGGQQELEPGLPMNFSVSVENVVGTATSVSIVLPGFYDGERISRTNFTVTFRHIPIQGR